MIQFKARTWFCSAFKLLCHVSRGRLLSVCRRNGALPTLYFAAHSHFNNWHHLACAALHNPAQKGIQRYAVLGAVFALAGSAISARHVWLQNLPPEEVPECSPGLSYIFENFPLSRHLN